MKKALRLLLASLITAGSLAAGVSAYGRFTDSVTVTNHISTGDINISLKELEKKENKEITYQDRKIVLPGDRISKIPRITNCSEPCWVRVKITYTDDLDGLKGLDDTNLLGMSSRWTKKGEYFYYTKQLEYGENVDIFTAVMVPREWTESYQEKNLGINIVADAIQAANFSPDFSAMTPWGNEKIQRCVHDTNGLVVKKKSQIKSKVEFEGSAHKLIAAPDDFFSGFSAAMPGDIFKDSVEIRNTTANTAEIFFRTSAECKSVKDQEFLRKQKLEISMDGKKLYEGDLLAVSLNKAVSLGNFAKNKSGKMEFQVTVPSELDNTYALRKGDVKWIFSVEEDGKIITPNPLQKQPEKERMTGRQGYYGNGNKGGSSFVRTTPVKTGDDTEILFWLLLGGAALFAGGLVIRKGGRT